MCQVFSQATPLTLPTHPGAQQGCAAEAQRDWSRNVLVGAAHGIHSARSASATENVKITIVAEPFNNIDRFKAVRDFFPDSGARSLLSQRPTATGELSGEH